MALNVAFQQKFLNFWQRLNKNCFYYNFQYSSFSRRSRLQLFHEVEYCGKVKSKQTCLCVCVYMCAHSEIRELRQLKFQSESKGGRRFRGAAVEADGLEEIKELKIDGHSEKFKDWNNKAPSTAALRAHITFYQLSSLYLYCLKLFLFCHSRKCMDRGKETLTLQYIWYFMCSYNCNYKKIYTTLFLF